MNSNPDWFTKLVVRICVAVTAALFASLSVNVVNIAVPYERVLSPAIVDNVSVLAAGVLGVIWVNKRLFNARQIDHPEGNNSQIESA
jgi:hypothetical protein